MATYVVTFRIANKTVGGRTYQDRYEDLVGEFSRLSHWFDTTSFYLVESHEDTYSFAARITQGLSSEHDMLLTFDPEDMSAASFGTVGHLDVLRHFLPSVKKIG